MHTRSGKTWSVYADCPTHTSDATPAPVVTHVPLNTSHLLQAALDREDHRSLDNPDDSEGASLEYGDTLASTAGPSSAALESPREPESALQVVSAPQVVEQVPAAHGGNAPGEAPYELGQIEKKRKRQQSNNRKKAKHVKLAQSDPLDRPGLHGCGLHAFPSVPTTPIELKVTDLPAAAAGGHIGKRSTPTKSTLWTLKELREEEHFAYKTWDGWYVGHREFKRKY